MSTHYQTYDPCDCRHFVSYTLYIIALLTHVSEINHPIQKRQDIPYVTIQAYSSTPDFFYHK